MAQIEATAFGTCTGTIDRRLCLARLPNL